MEIYGFIFSAAEMWLLGICGALIMAFLGVRLAIVVQRYGASVAASHTFRNIILSELKGLYPVNDYWDKSIFPRFKQSIAKIESAATEFQFFIPFYQRKAYKKALSDYYDYCNKITWYDVAGYYFWPENQENPREQFKNIVDRILSFSHKWIC
jgi:hypothetical protein